MPKCIERACPFPSVLPDDAATPYCRTHFAIANPVSRYEGINPFPTLLAEKQYVEETLSAIAATTEKRKYCTRKSMQPASDHVFNLALKENRRRDRIAKKEQLSATFAPSAELDTLMYLTTNTISLRIVNDNFEVDYDDSTVPESFPIQDSQHEQRTSDTDQERPAGNAQDAVSVEGEAQE